MSDSELDEAPSESADAKAQELKERLAQWKRSRLAPGAAKADDDDPLDDFMSGLEVPKDVQTHITRPGVVTLDDLAAQLDDDAAAPAETGEDTFLQSLIAPRHAANAAAGENGNDSDDDDDDKADDEELLEDDDVVAENTDKTLTALEMLRQKAAKKVIKRVDHSKMDYAPFRKDFYVMAPEIARLSDEQVDEVYESLEAKVRGKNPPRPIERWDQCGLTQKLLECVAEQGWEKPFPVQRLAIPAIMSGRDVMGIAQTGSGKTLAYLIPMLRHIKDQAPLAPGDGPIALVIAPARELAVQIHKEVKRFLKSLQIESVCMYGGSHVGDQISAVRRGAHVVVGTPGRLIDVLATKGGRSLPLSRVTFVVLDEADRLFDMGFEPQVESILANVRPDRQTVLFSATFPSHVERLARQTLQKDPLHLIVGGGARVSQNITQIVELRPANEKFARLLQLLGEWSSKGHVLVFCDTQQGCDALYLELERAGYPCLTLHGGKDQMDRDYTMNDFKTGKRTLMVATGVAGRGLDVPELNLVVNFDCPNHVEEYVHRVGRTGRAGRPGTAVTFLMDPEDAKYAGDVMLAVKRSGQPVPEFLKRMRDEFASKVSAGTEHRHMSGYKTKGFSFDSDATGYTAALKRVKSDYSKQLRGVTDEADDAPGSAAAAAAATAAAREEEDEIPTEIIVPGAPPIFMPSARGDSLAGALSVKGGVVNLDGEVRIQLTDAERRLIETQRNKIANDPAAQAKAADKVPMGPISVSQMTQAPGGHSLQELEINDLPGPIRVKVTSKRMVNHIESEFKVSLTVKGSYIPPSRPPAFGEKKLHFVFEATNPQVVADALHEMTRIIEDEASRMNNDDSMDRMHAGGMGGASTSRYRM